MLTINIPNTFMNILILIYNIIYKLYKCININFNVPKPLCLPLLY